MKKRDLIFALICVAVVAGLAYLSITGQHPKPTYQSIPEHQSLKPLAKRDQCLVCHDPQNGTIVDVSKRIPSNHPEKWKDEKFPCIGCHTLQPGPEPHKATINPFAQSSK
jgi:hypothetical protein